MGKVDGIHNEIHIHCFREYYPDYHKSIHGTIDHEIGDKNNVSDCRIENLRAASLSQQSQNRERFGTLPYKGVSISGDKFFAIFGWKGKTVYGERRIYIEDAARDYNIMAKEKWESAYQNDIPDTKTPAEFFYHKSKLTVEKIENFTTTEIITVLFVNSDWAEICDLSIAELFDIKRKFLDKYKKLIRELFLDEQIDESYLKDEEDKQIDESYLKDEEDKQIDESYLKDEEEEGEEEEEFGNETKKILQQRRYVPMEIDPELDASSVGCLCYGYTKRFDRSRIVIDESEAEIIRIIFREINKGLKRGGISKLLNQQNFKKDGENWTSAKVYSVIIYKKRYEGSLVEGHLCRYPKIL